MSIFCWISETNEAVFMWVGRQHGLWNTKHAAITLVPITTDNK